MILDLSFFFLRILSYHLHMTEQYLVESVELRPSDFCAYKCLYYIRHAANNCILQEQLFHTLVQCFRNCFFILQTCFQQFNHRSFNSICPQEFFKNPVDTYQLPFPTQLGPILVLFHILLHPKMIPYLSHRNAHPCEKNFKAVRASGHS